MIGLDLVLLDQDLMPQDLMPLLDLDLFPSLDLMRLSNLRIASALSFVQIMLVRDTNYDRSTSLEGIVKLKGFRI